MVSALDRAAIVRVLASGVGATQLRVFKVWVRPGGDLEW